MKPGIKEDEENTPSVVASSGGGAQGASPALAAAEPVLGPVKEEIKEATTRLNTAGSGQAPRGPMRRFHKQVEALKKREEDREKAD